MKMPRQPLFFAVLGLAFASFVAGAIVSSGSSFEPSTPPSSPPEPVEFENGSDTLRGRVFLPEGKTDVAGVVILGGSERGPQTVLKSRLAQHFADAGIAALIYDSPGTGRSTGNAMLQTRDDRAEEALAAIRCLGQQQSVRADHVGVMGISEGALIALLAAARDESVAFAIPVSGAFGVPMLEAARHRIESGGLARHLDPEQLQKAVLLEEILFGLLTGPDLFEWRVIDMKASQWPQESWLDLVETVRTMRNALTAEEKEANWQSLKRALTSFRSEPWFDLVVVDLNRFDGLMSMRSAQFYVLLEHGSLANGDFEKVRHELEEYPKVRCPVFAVWGEHDEFLPPRRSAGFLRRCLSDAGHEDATYLIVPEASHILTKPGSDKQFVDGYPQFLADWIVQRF
jgi:pimeloyl-ACP methyl ester carboxylesterase